ncbi:MAG: HypC/HybG/HupF family hydrogenase formation chaperone [Actinobacteria bacterium]|nr:HypC/HybG/HupF family hydrogenase formation chaperone [Actinomycetota bacterium]
MCLAIPAVIKKINRNVAEIESLGVVKKIDISLVPYAVVGDYVIVHAGFAIQVIDKNEALITEDYWKDYFEAMDEIADEQGSDFIDLGENEDIQ